jgi:15-cis-phytoene synthase
VNTFTDLTARKADRIIRSRARSFYLASVFLPSAVRRDVRFMYAYYRTVDDLVDQPPPSWSRARVQEELERLRIQEIAPPMLNALLLEIAQIARRHQVPIRLLDMIIEGARFDLERKVIETMDDLIEYSVLVAGSVGMVMSHVLGARDEVSVAAARDLGVAMQLTNVLRDVVEDADHGRVYLPREDLERCGCSLSAQKPGRLTPEFQEVLRVVALEARRRYIRGWSGIARLDPSVRFSIALAATLYSRILDKIERSDFDVFTGRVRVGRIEKWALVMPTYMHHRQTLR